jgi:hypothetical protein
MAGVGWSLAAVGLARWPAVALPLLGLLTVAVGALATMASMDGRKARDRCWLMLGGTLSVAILALAWFEPQWLNPKWAIDFAVAVPDPDRPLQVSLDGQTGTKELRDSDWVDASQASIRRGDVHIRIDWVRVAPLPSKERSKRASPARLLIRLSVANVGFLRRISYGGAGKHVSVVRDNLGNEYSRHSLDPDLDTTAQVLLPAEHTDDLLAFEPPPPDVGHLELEVPVAVWGGEGICRFRIPRAMIVFASPDPEKQ